MRQKGNEFTRIDGHSKPIIDLYFTSESQSYVEIDNVDQVTDHKMLLICSECSKKSYERLKCVDWSKYNKRSFTHEVAREIKSREIENMSMQMRFF